jgi:vacuolar-type H+-ATPase subunit H
MTVLDDVLTAEKSSAQQLSEAKEAAVAAVLAAKNDQTETLLSEQKRLAEFEKTELTNHEKNVANLAEKITHDAETKVHTVEKKFSDKKSEIIQKIKQALS